MSEASLLASAESLTMEQKEALKQGYAKLHRQKQVKAYHEHRMATDPEYVKKRAEYGKKWRQENRERVNQLARERRRAAGIGPKPPKLPEEELRKRHNERNRLYKMRIKERGTI